MLLKRLGSSLCESSLISRFLCLCCVLIWLIMLHVSVVFAQPEALCFPNGFSSTGQKADGGE